MYFIYTSFNPILPTSSDAKPDWSCDSNQNSNRVPTITEFLPSFFFTWSLPISSASPFLLLVVAAAFSFSDCVAFFFSVSFPVRDPIGLNWCFFYAPAGIYLFFLSLLVFFFFFSQWKPNWMCRSIPNRIGLCVSVCAEDSIEFAHSLSFLSVLRRRRRRRRQHRVRRHRVFDWENSVKPSQTQSNPVKPSQTQSNPVETGKT